MPKVDLSKRKSPNKIIIEKQKEAKEEIEVELVFEDDEIVEVEEEKSVSSEQMSTGSASGSNPPSEGREADSTPSASKVAIKPTVLVKEKPSQEDGFQEFPISIIPTGEVNEVKGIKLPSDEQIDRFIAIRKKVKKSIVDPSDFATVKGKKFMTKSGFRKYVHAYGITLEIIRDKVYELMGDWHCEMWVRATLPNGQFVDAIGIKSMKELYDKTLHNLKTNASTRAKSRAISDIVAYGEVSAEEVKNTPIEDEDWDITPD